MRIHTLVFLLSSMIACEGPEGPAGPQGAAGLDGDNGEDGKPGDDGKDGADGTDGTDGEDGADGRALTLNFEAAAFPKTDAEKRAVLASRAAWVDGEEVKIGYNTLLRSGQKLGATTFGLVLDKDGKAIKQQDGSELLADSMDFSSYLEVEGKLFNITHFESNPGSMFLTEVSQDPATGKLTATSTKPIDFGEWGLWNPCAGSVTPWNTHLGGEEYPLDAWAWQKAAKWQDLGGFGNERIAAYRGVDPYTAPWETVKANFRALGYGFPVEVAVDKAGATKVTKHFAMGRHAVELAYVMPDEKTAFIASDDTNQGFFMFVADKARDLSSGTLYAAQFLQTSPNGATYGHGDLNWINLGKATNAQVEAALNENFNDWWEYTAPVSGVCPAGYTGVNIVVSGSPQCLKIKAGKELAASRLDTRRYAAYLGATTEFRKEEGITFDPATNRLFVAYSEVERGMESFASGGKPSTSFDTLGPDHMRLGYNACGAVYAMDLGPDASLGTNYAAYNMYSLIEGIPMTYPAGSPFAGNTCSINHISSPDNLTFIPGYDTLIIGEDTFPGHQNDVLWALDMRNDKLTRIQSTPYGAETTSPYWYPEIGSYAYLSSSIQHPFGESDQSQLKDPAEARGYIGYVGPFPAMPWR